MKELENKPSAGEQRAHSATLGDVFLSGARAVIRESCLLYPRFQVLEIVPCS